MYIIVCDKCGKQSEPQKDAYTTKDYTTISYRGGYAATVNKIICNECAVKMGIEIDDPNKARQSIGDNLLDILTEIAQNAIQE